MTCEVCIMNRHGIVLAADSATTVTEWIDGKYQPRYFKGANKILLLSHHKPVALMTYGSADLQGLPWETITKEFANTIKQKSFNETHEYACELFDFISSNVPFFSESHRKEQFLSHVRRVIFEIVLMITENETVKTAAGASERAGAAAAILAEYEGNLGAAELPPGFDSEDIAASLAAHSNTILSDAKEFTDGSLIEGAMDLTRLCRLSVESLYKHYDKCLESTGIVVAGFGDHEYLPSVCEYSCYGFLLSRLMYTEEHKSAITSSNLAYIKAFAQSDMIDTFERGVGFDVYATVNKETEKCLSDFAQAICTKLGVSAVDGLEETINEFRERHANAWLEAAFNAHSRPLWRVISYLPIPDMAHLAETLVSLQSLKERVTAPSESVSGPIDVAVVTRGDGVVWIKRKHYFNGELNPRYFMRAKQVYG